MTGFNGFIFLSILLCAGTSVLCTQVYNDQLLFVIGDSLFDPGNNQFIGDPPPPNYWPYGMSFNNHSTGRFSDGLIVPDFIASFAKLRFPVPYLNKTSNFSDGASFASGGAGVFNNHSYAINLEQQISNLTSYVDEMNDTIGKDKSEEILKRSVLLFSLGGNDYMDYNTHHENATIPEQQAVVTQVIQDIIEGFKAIYTKSGIRKVAIQNVGPLGLYPMVKAQNSNGTEQHDVDIERFSRQAKMHNSNLSIYLEELAESGDIPDFKYAVFDFNTQLGNRIRKPINYGFISGEYACCGNDAYNGDNCGKYLNISCGETVNASCGTQNFTVCCSPDEYVLFDGGHNSQHTNFQLATLFWNGSTDVVAPYNVKTLFEPDDVKEEEKPNSQFRSSKSVWSII